MSCGDILLLPCFVGKVKLARMISRPQTWWLFCYIVGMLYNYPALWGMSYPGLWGSLQKRPVLWVGWITHYQTQFRRYISSWYSCGITPFWGCKQAHYYPALWGLLIDRPELWGIELAWVVGTFYHCLHCGEGKLSQNCGKVSNLMEYHNIVDILLIVAFLESEWFKLQCG